MPARAQLRREHDEFRLGGVAQRHAEHLAARGVCRRLALGREREHGPVDAEAEPDARQRLPAEFAPSGRRSARRRRCPTGRRDRRARTRTSSSCSSPGPAPCAGSPRTARRARRGSRAPRRNGPSPTPRGGRSSAARRRSSPAPRGRLSSSTRSGLISARRWVSSSRGEPEQELLQQFPVLRAAGVVAERGDLEPEPVEAERRNPASAMAMTSASRAGSSTPMASMPTCCSWRYRPACGRS